MIRCPVCHRLVRAEAGCPLHLEDSRVEGGEVAFESGQVDDRWRPEIPGIEIVSLLGQGGFASVYLARQAGGPELAVKVAHTREDQRFPREAAALRRVGPPTCPELLGAGTTGQGRPYLLMERLEGETLTERLAAAPGSGALRIGQVLPLAGALCHAVERMHEAGVVHRDLKPQNVFLCRSGRLALLDFGLARGVGAADEVRAAAPHLTRTGERMGTALYMSPEQCQEAREAGHRSDIYSLGVMLFEMLTGRPPFVGDLATVMAAHVSKRPPRVSELAGLAPAFDEVMVRCLAKPPAARFGSARELYQALERAATASTAARPASPARQDGPAPRSSSRRPVALLAVRSPLPADQLASRLSSEGGVLARVHGDRYLFAFPGETAPESGLRVAARAGSHLVEQGEAGTDVVVHLAELRVRETAGGLAVAGGALERPGDWVPAGLPPGLHLTAAVSEVTGVGIAEPGGGMPLDTPTPTSSQMMMMSGAAAGAVPLVGRDALLDSALREGRAALEERCPALTTLVGDTGLGKSRVLSALAERAGPQARVVRTAARPPAAGDPEVVLRALLSVGLELAEGADAAAVEAACRDRLGGEHGEAAWPAVALVLGALDEDDARVRPILGAPGALRQTLARAAGAALRRVASAPLAIFVDDAHWADQASLDALEMCTLEGAELPIWVCVTAQPTLLTLRSLWGERAGRAAQLSVGTLPPGAMSQLAVELLRPVEFVPDPVIGRLLEMTQGVPLYMVELVQALRSAGAIRRHRGTEEWYVAADEIPHVAAGAPAAALAGHAMASLPSHLASLAGLCAVIGEEIATAEVDALTLSLPADEASLDPAFGLPRLVRFGLLRRAGKGYYSFRHPMVRDAVEARIAPARRRQLHKLVLDHLIAAGDRSRSRLERMARHAAACGEAALAADSHLELAEEDRRRHRYVDAETHYTSALERLPRADTDRRERVLAGRGKVRYRLQRFQEALADLEAARALAEARADDAAVADLLLEEAIVLDWSHGWAESARRVALAAPIVERLGDRRLEVRCRMARGRTMWRQDQAQEAIELLSEAAEVARQLEEREVYVISLLLLSPALSVRGMDRESEERFAEVISACQESGDSFHLCAAYNNRIFLWISRKEIDKATEDQHRAITLARELGFGVLERGASYNLAELLYWLGDDATAMALAQRSRVLAERLDLGAAHDLILLARIQSARADVAAARASLDAALTDLKDEESPPLIRAFQRLVELRVADQEGRELRSADWNALISEMDAAAFPDELMETLHSALGWATRHGDLESARRWGERAMELARNSPIWRDRFAVAAEATAE